MPPLTRKVGKLAFHFEILHKDSSCYARSGILKTAHGQIETPVFMPVGTQAAVKTLSPSDLKDCDVQIILSNTYHLYLRPGWELIKDLTGLHSFMGWDRALLTDSGGYQIFSLRPLARVSQQGVAFQSHLDGSHHFLTPEDIIEIQEGLGSDIIMLLDECPPYPSTYDYTLTSVKVTLHWAERGVKVHKRKDQALFGIVQGGMFKDLRELCCDRLMALDLAGYAVGGLCVGESRSQTFEIIEHTLPLLPEDRPRYIMGFGAPEDLLQACKLGADMFDCVIPTRNARNGTLFTTQGKVIIKNSQYKDDPSPLDANCNCYTCLNFSKAYLRHLFCSEEIMALRLNSLHNIHYFSRLMREIRRHIQENKLAYFDSSKFGF